LKNSVCKIQNLSVSYDETVIKGLNLDIYEGEILCIVGESGSGKSTLLKAITGVGDSRVDEGKILFKDVDITGLRERERSRMLGTEIGYIQQNPAGAFNPIRKFDKQFRETFKSSGLEMDYDKIGKVFSVLGLRDVDKLLQSRPYEMSGGMNQRIAIAAAMVLEPKILLCDEITSALDVSTSMKVCNELKKINEVLKTTIVMVTHSLGVASKLADRIVIMKDGKIVEQGSQLEVLTSPCNEYTKQLLRDVPRLKVD
jgi:ABC-type dipeptide/oligopeptide/nickel transport system ATPase component